MKQTSIEWLEMEIVKIEKDFAIPSKIYELCEQAKEMHDQEQDEFAIGFAEWVEYSCWKIESDRYLYEDDQFSTKELLEIYKKEKGL